MNRGRRGEDVFSDKKDYELFLAILRESAEMFGVRIAAYCLMPNHYHLLLQTPSANLSRVMRHVNCVYTQRYNRSRQVDGQLFRGYKSILVEEDSYLLELLRYIHRNPVRAGMCDSIMQYPWSSHHAYLSAAKKCEWLHKRFLLEMFSHRPANAKRQYMEFVEGEDSDLVVAGFFGRKNLATIFGSQDFIN